MKKVCVDTNILIWYIKKECTKGQEDMLEKAEYLFDYFERSEILIVIPSLVVAELLGNVEDEEKREEFFDYITANFEIAQHDIVSARKYIKLRLELSKKNAKSYASSNGIPKCQMINDYNICSVAISSGCDAIFSHNLQDFEKFANHEIDIFTLDYVDELKAQARQSIKLLRKNPDQTSLLDDLEELDNDIPAQ